MVLLSQVALIDKIIRVFNQTEATPALTPMVHGSLLMPPDPQTPLDEGEQS